MKRLSILALLAIATCGNAIFAMDSDRPAAYTVLDAAALPNKISGEYNWEAIFGMLDRMKGIINVNEYRLPGGKTLLIAATAAGNHLAVLKLLEEYHANPNVSVPQGGTALRTAIGWRNKKIEDLLRSHGAINYR